MKTILGIVLGSVAGAIIIWLSLQVFVAIAPQTADSTVKIGKSVVGFLSACADRFDDWVASWSSPVSTTP